jgi:hypothetical protein
MIPSARALAAATTPPHVLTLAALCDFCISAWLWANRDLRLVVRGEHATRTVIAMLEWVHKLVV